MYDADAVSRLPERLGESSTARRIEIAVDSVLSSGVWTKDLGGRATTEDVTEAVCIAVQSERAVTGKN